MRDRLKKILGFKEIGAGKRANIYHCCVQKTASQWVKRILSDRVVFKGCRMTVLDPGINFIGDVQKRAELKKSFPSQTIISPLYILYEDFEKIGKPPGYRAFYVMRDPRDLLISYYFSTRFSHADNPYVAKQRAILSKMDNNEALSYFIEKINNEHNQMYNGMRTWYTAGKKEKGVMVFRYEDLTGPEQIKHFIKLFEHLDFNFPVEKIKKLLKKHNFRILAKGREPGIEDRNSHYRKGISGDWKNYFTEKHKTAFKKAAGQLLIDLDYEKDFNW